jgi:hypothetical protein
MVKPPKKDLDKRIVKIAAKLKQLRKESGYKNYDVFAWDNDISRTNYQRMESGCNFTIESFLKLLDIHKMSLEDFFTGMK